MSVDVGHGGTQDRTKASGPSFSWGAMSIIGLIIERVGLGAPISRVPAHWRRPAIANFADDGAITRTSTTPSTTTTTKKTAQRRKQICRGRVETKTCALESTYELRRRDGIVLKKTKPDTEAMQNRLKIVKKENKSHYGRNGHHVGKCNS